MTAPAAESSADLRCHRCGYDLRAHPPEGKCPECGTSIAESRQMAASPIRPRWRDSDPRWRRRMLAGVWILALLPLMDVLRVTAWASDVPLPNLFGYGAVRTLDDTLLTWQGVYQSLAFCIGMVLLFSKERGRRRARLDWTRRWGVACTYIVLLLRAAEVLIIAALVLAGIAAIFQGMPAKYQPRVTQLFVRLSTGYLRYGAYPETAAALVLIASSSIAVLLACIPLYQALSSSGPKRVGVILLAPLALFAFGYLGLIGLYFLHHWLLAWSDFGVGIFFWPAAVVGYIAGPPPGMFMSPTHFSVVVVEAIKWCVVFVIAIWLSVAQIASWRKERKRPA